MFADGELVLDMSYGPFSVASGIEEGIYTDTTQTFVFDNGTIGNTNYMGIAFNSPNKAGAMVVINAILSGEIQLTQYAQLKELPGPGDPYPGGASVPPSAGNACQPCSCDRGDLAQ